MEQAPFARPGHFLSMSELKMRVEPAARERLSRVGPGWRLPPPKR